MVKSQELGQKCRVNSPIVFQCVGKKSGWKERFCNKAKRGLPAIILQIINLLEVKNLAPNFGG